jgi:hypothetical protein
VLIPDGSGPAGDESRSRHRHTARQEAEMFTYPMTHELAAARRDALLDEAAFARLARNVRPASRRPRRGAIRLRWHRPLIARPVHV